jgi:hypothetical protein
MWPLNSTQEQPSEYYAMKKIALISLLCVLSGFATAQTFYRWTDPQGSTHYTETPPKGQSSTSINVDTGTSEETQETDATPNSPSASSAATSAASSTDKPDDKPKSKLETFKERCAKNQENLALLNSDQTLTTKNKDGKLIAISSDERKQMKQNAEEMAAACPPAESSK